MGGLPDDFAVIPLFSGSPLPVSLEDKLAAMVWYLDEVRSGRRQADPKALDSYLDDPEVAGWLDKMNKAGRIKNTRFISNSKHREDLWLDKQSEAHDDT